MQDVVVSKQSKQVLKVSEKVSPCDLIAVEWYDASVGKSTGSGMAINVPVKSWASLLGLSSTEFSILFLLKTLENKIIYYSLAVVNLASKPCFLLPPILQKLLYANLSLNSSTVLTRASNFWN